MASLLIYGSYGFVGNLAAREATDRGLEPILAGRDRDALDEQVDDLDRPARRFDLDDPGTLATAVSDVDCMLNCAGPFSNTAEPLVEGCIRGGTDYVDITGEIPVIERVRDCDAAAANAGVTLLPSVGFSSIPMGCLAAHLADRLPGATGLALGVDSLRPPSIGSIRTVLEGVDTGGAVRRGGRLESVPAAWRTHRVDFGRGARPAVTMPLGDVSTAYYATGVPDVEVYAFVPQPARLALRTGPPARFGVPLGRGARWRRAPRLPRPDARSVRRDRRQRRNGRRAGPRRGRRRRLSHPRGRVRPRIRLRPDRRGGVLRRGPPLTGDAYPRRR